MRIAVSVRPNSRAEEVNERPSGPLVVKVKPPAREGRANEALLRVLSRHLKVPRTALRIVRGARGRDKLVEVDDRYLDRPSRSR